MSNWKILKGEKGENLFKTMCFAESFEGSTGGLVVVGMGYWAVASSSP